MRSNYYNKYTNHIYIAWGNYGNSGYEYYYSFEPVYWRNSYYISAHYELNTTRSDSDE